MKRLVLANIFFHEINDILFPIMIINEKINTINLLQIKELKINQ